MVIVHASKGPVILFNRMEYLKCCLSTSNDDDDDDDDDIWYFQNGFNSEVVLELPVS